MILSNKLLPGAAVMALAACAAQTQGASKLKGLDVASQMTQDDNLHASS
jgi:hypothetical protein